MPSYYYPTKEIEHPGNTLSEIHKEMLISLKDSSPLLSVFLNRVILECSIQLATSISAIYVHSNQQLHTCTTVVLSRSCTVGDNKKCTYTCNYTSNKNIHFEMILDVGIGEKRKETRF